MKDRYQLPMGEDWRISNVNSLELILTEARQSLSEGNANYYRMHDKITALIRIVIPLLSGLAYLIFSEVNASQSSGNYTVASWIVIGFLAVSFSGCLLYLGRMLYTEPLAVEGVSPRLLVKPTYLYPDDRLGTVDNEPYVVALRGLIESIQWAIDHNEPIISARNRQYNFVISIIGLSLALSALILGVAAGCVG